jgi:hypothetical protein
MFTPSHEATWQTWERMIDDGTREQMRGHLYEAELIYKAALALAERTKISIHCNIAKTCMLLAELYCEQKQYAKSEAFYRCALAIYENIPVTGAIDACIALKRISEICRLQDKVSEAEETRRRADTLVEGKRRQLEAMLRLNQCHRWRPFGGS